MTWPLGKSPDEENLRESNRGMRSNGNGLKSSMLLNSKAVRVCPMATSSRLSSDFGAKIEEDRRQSSCGMASLAKVKVLLRIRPYLAQEKQQQVPLQGAALTLDAQKSSVYVKNPRNPLEELQFNFDSCFQGEDTQESIFEQGIAPLLPFFLRGYNMTLFAYGNTGAGKTYTMEGCPGCPGMIPQSLAYLFARLSLAALQKRGLLLSFLEIYNEKVYDLLVTQNASGQMPDLAIREDAHKNILVPHMTKVPVTTLADFERWWAIGRRNRSTAATKLNAQSSRSHSILMLQLDASLFCDVSEDVRQAAAPAKLHLIDLAGSEDNRKTDNTGVRLLESTSINTSLFVLGKVVDALNQQQKSAAAGQKTASAQQLRIPYRDSKLTRLLQDSLGGKAIAVMIANVSPLMAHFHETLNTLTFAAKSKQISNVVQMAHWKEARKRRRSIESVPETLAAVADSPSAPVSSQTRGKPTEHALDSLFSSEQQGKHPIALLQQEQLLQRKLEDLLRQKLQDGQGFLTPILEKKLSKSASLVGGGHAPSLLQRHLKKRLCGAQAHAPQMTEFMTPTTRGKTARSIVTKALQIESLAAVSCGSDKWHSALHNYKLALKLLPTNEKLLRKIAYIERQLSGGGAAIENSPMIRPPTKRRKNGHCRASEKSLDDEGAEGKSGSSPVPFSYPAPPRAIKEMDSGALGTYTETCLLALLNFGGKKHVMQLPGIGAKRFEKLEGERNRHGSFYTVPHVLERLGWSKSFVQSLTQAILAQQLLQK